MSERPIGWAEATLEDLCSFENGDRGKNYSGRSTFVASGVPFISAGHLNNGYIDWDEMNYIPQANYDRLGSGKVKSGDFLFCLRGSLGKHAFVSKIDAAAIASSLVIVRPSDLTDIKFFDYYLRGPLVKSSIEVYSNGVAQPNLSSANLGRFEFPLPPLAEQKRIVAKLDALNAKSARARTELSRIAALVSRYKQSVLSKAFSEVVTRKVVGELVARIKAGKNLRCEERPPHLHEKGVVKVSAVTWGEFRADESKTLPPDFRLDEDTRINPGDFLFSRANTIELVGAVVIVAETPDNLYLSDKILRLEFNESVEAWLLWYLRSSEGREALMNISSGNQLSMRNIGQKNLLSMSVPYADLESRNETVRRIETAFAKIDRLAIEAKRALKLVGKLDQAILAKAFRGELVPQDAADEPAEKLLKRIRAEREAAPKARRGRGKKT